MGCLTNCAVVPHAQVVDLMAEHMYVHNISNQILTEIKYTHMNPWSDVN